ncbi:MAG TPA: triose-phosphate isomerase [Chloroflexia bacterium]|nr:triose-phosphate isomerase [Chloroflexia bacterium]
MAATRTPIIAGNWKMHTTVAAAMILVEDMLDDLDSIEGVEIVLCPPFISLMPVWEMVQETAITVGAQNLYPAPQGAYTGEIAPTMLAPLCRYVILGHSERRTYFGETDEVVAAKVQAALQYGLRPIVCVGESLEEHESHQRGVVLDRQVRAVFSGMDAEQAASCVVAYEPIWAIGTGRAATAMDAQLAINGIRDLLRYLVGPEAAAAIRIQYGGSVTGANAAEFFSQPDIDGALVGGASLKPADFVRICAVAQQAKHEAGRGHLGML